MRKLVMELREHELTKLSALKTICEAMNHHWKYSVQRRRFVCCDCFVEMAGLLVEGTLSERRPGHAPVESLTSH